MEKKELLSYKPGVILQGTYKSYGRFGFLITDDDHEDVYIAEKDHLNAVNNDIVEVKTKREKPVGIIQKGLLRKSLKGQMILLYVLTK